MDHMQYLYKLLLHKRGNRLTVLSARRRNPAINTQPADDPKSEFGSFSAVPDTPANFGNR